MLRGVVPQSFDFINIFLRRYGIKLDLAQPKRAHLEIEHWTSSWCRGVNQFNLLAVKHQPKGIIIWLK